MDKPTAAELEILAILWEKEQASVRQVHEELSLTKETGYTTTLKTMQNMHAKGLLARDEEKRSHIYSALISQEDTQQSLVRNFIGKAFGGSAKKLVMQALGQSEPSKEEIKEIRAFLDKIENDTQ
ncbi:MAG: BlaI/MecI/CopY family transcriptional regulator [Cytophagales bacterium]|uniref:BlaI/MecI/CopY family transcriptional regulator n=1 Tax=Cyclobacterium marinum TaxID=104 RepID=UPI0011ED22B2|nr:BlaI/MecI/CopY family transcriptional regulator [Cyclobacterium marinum]MBI0401375.1 BlaI/MecI/CopY family transcriptional regulator [Cyclobacterium marinum]MBR9777489.1 BlaI/MecI/CopY family transcriptional regulator [Cytophagales bacterium]|tara:strand:+ start:2985 stop:3359 length:375 start_codon:yes stop_codon:yes gene_type:complete